MGKTYSVLNACILEGNNETSRNVSYSGRCTQSQTHTDVHSGIVHNSKRPGGRLNILQSGID